MCNRGREGGGGVGGGAYYGRSREDITSGADDNTGPNLVFLIWYVRCNYDLPRRLELFVASLQLCRLCSFKQKVAPLVDRLVQEPRLMQPAGGSSVGG